MPNNWKTYKLDEVLEIKNGKSKPKEIGKIPIYGGNGILGYTSKVNNDSQVIIIGRVGAYCGSVYYEDKPVWISDNAMSAKVKDNGCNQFFYYLLKKMDLNSFAGGSSQPLLTQSTLNSIKVRIPPLPEQKAIANILSAIDDKIENNLAINKTLEDMAMALYKHWFVDFGPFQDGEFVDSELGPIPKGWEVKRLGDFCTLTMGQSPKSEFYNNIKKGLPFHQGVKDYGERFPIDETYSTEGKRLAEKGDVLFSVRAPVGRLNIAKNQIILGRGLASIKMNDFNHFGFLFYALNTRFTEDDIIGDGTVYKSVNKSDLQNLKFLIPPNELINDFNHKVESNDEKYLNNFKENQSLTQLRDTLLPKLISGEVRLKEFKEQIQTVL